MTLAQRGMAFLERVLPVTHGVTGGVTYVRVGAVAISGVSAVFGRTLFNLQDRSSGGKVVWGERDYLIAATELVATGTPRQGDRISHGGEVFEVFSPGASEPHWRWSDNQRTIYRIHTRKVV